MRTFVKISGIRDAASLALVPEGGAAGFYVDEASPRRIPIERIEALLDELPKEAEAWAIVTDPTAETIHRLFDTGVDRIQVHGSVPDGLEFLEIHSLVPSLPIPLPGSGGADPKVPPAEDYARLHLDAVGDPISNGSAVRSDWEVCARLVDTNPGRKLTLAGGLTADNVREALETVRPWGVDVAAGVESSPGTLDRALIEAFLAAIRGFEQATPP